MGGGKGAVVGSTGIDLQITKADWGVAATCRVKVRWGLRTKRGSPLNNNKNKNEIAVAKCFRPAELKTFSSSLGK